MSIFLCGADRADITPEIGTCLFGYRPDLESNAIHDHINVTAAAFSDGVTTFVLVTCDVCEIDNDLAERAVREIASSTGLPESSVIISATHTHSAPNVAGLEGWGGIDTEYAENIFLPAVKKAALGAVSNMKNAVLGVSTTKSDVGMNRREILRNGAVVLGQNPFGVYDPEMTVIAVRDEEGKGIINMVHYGCHGTAAGENREISRDWQGIMMDRLEKESGVITAFWQGCCGDVGPRNTNGFTVGCGDIKYAEELGAVAAMDAVRAYRQIKSFGKKEIRLFTGKVTLPLKELPDLEDIEKRIASYEEPEKLINIDRLRYNHLVSVAAAIKSGKRDSEFTFDASIPVVGDIAFLPFPFEMFSSTGLRLRRYAPYQHVLSLSCSNGTNLYLPSKGEILNGGYEVECFLYGHDFNFTDDAETIIINEYLRILGA